MTKPTAPAGGVTLHGYFRSSAAYRVRIALNLKGLAWTHRGVHLLRGEQRGDAYLDLNPQGLVPALQEGEFVLTQSLAIIEYLEERHPDPPLLPRDLYERARVRQIALAIACDIHPLNNLRVLKTLEHDVGLDDAAKRAWIARWIAEGFRALEAEFARQPSSPFCVGVRPTIADCCLVPQVFNARRFDVDLSPYARVREIAQRCETLDAFQRAQPSQQPDAT
jgi:maleylacetoacetate isomerase